LRLTQKSGKLAVFVQSLNRINTGMDVFKKVKDILMELLDVEDYEITPETYLVRDLEVESIDMLELAVSFNAAFDIEVNDDDLFLKDIRSYIPDNTKLEGGMVKAINEKYPFLSQGRIKEIIYDLQGGPTLKVKDLISYITGNSFVSNN